MNLLYTNASKNNQNTTSFTAFFPRSRQSINRYLSAQCTTYQDSTLYVSIFLVSGKREGKEREKPLLLCTIFFLYFQVCVNFKGTVVNRALPSLISLEITINYCRVWPTDCQLVQILQLESIQPSSLSSSIYSSAQCLTSPWDPLQSSVSWSLNLFLDQARIQMILPRSRTQLIYFQLYRWLLLSPSVQVNYYLISFFRIRQKELQRRLLI